VLFRRLFVGLSLVTTVALGVFVTGGAMAAPKVVFSPPIEGAKVTLPETSPDGAALWTSTTGTMRAVIAWTGSDAQHHLNYMSSADGLHYTHKRMLGYTSLWRPAVVFNASGRGEPYGDIILAWTSVSAPHAVNVAYIQTPEYQVVRTFTLGADTSFTAPSLTVLNDTVYLAFAGNDNHHSLNIRTIDRTGVVGPKVTLWQYSSISRPDLSYDWATDSFLLAWTGGDQRLSFAESHLDVNHFVSPSNNQLVEWSAWAPSMRGLHSINMPVHWLAWTGALNDAQHHVNIQYTESFPNWSNVNSKTTLGETAIAGPGLGYVGAGGQALVTWTGTDAAHHLNVAVIYVKS
jgi:hypothetical protein